MLRLQVSSGVVVLFLAFAAPGECQVAQPWLQRSHSESHAFCQPQPPRPRPVSRTVQVDVPVPSAPVSCMAVPACAPHPCCPPPYPSLCRSKPVQVRVDVVVKPEPPKPCVPQRYCCENPPIFEPIFYHAAWMLQSIVAAPLGLGECTLGHGMIRQTLPPPIPVACVPCPVVPCQPPQPMCQPLVPQCRSNCQPVVKCALPAARAQPVSSRPQQKYAPRGNSPFFR
jgi:hypothetical protein